MQAKPANITYDISKLRPVATPDQFAMHLKIHQKHIDNFNNSEGDIPFEKAGAYLHKLFFENIRERRVDNQPLGKVAEILELRYGTWDNFYKTYQDTVNKLQGSGWVFMNTSGYLNIIPNNRIVDNIAFVIDFWEHAYYPQFGTLKAGYAKEMLHLINWEEVNHRILSSKDKKREKQSITG